MRILAAGFRVAALAAAILLWMAPGRPLEAQSAPGAGCQAPTPPPSADAKVFTPEQERDLGDIIAEQFEAELQLISDDALVAPLREIGARVAKHLPPSFRVAFHLIDFPDPNAFVLPGGRVYVTRKLVAMTRSEDELAGVLGHELGHFAARQQVATFARQLRTVLGVTEVGDRHDIELKFNRLMDNAARRPGEFETESHDRAEQLEADRIGLFLTAAGGYDPAAHGVLFARLSGATAKRGFMSRVFGTVSPNTKRLGELMRGAATLPPACVTARVAGADEAYQRWQLALARHSGIARPERLPADVQRKQLSSFRGQVTRLRFSPDGRFILAQDDAGVTVLTSEPTESVLRVEAPGALPAQFTADSAAVFVYSRDLRIERWDLTTRRLAAVRELAPLNPCFWTALSGDGRFLACVDLEAALTILEVETGQTVFQRANFYRLGVNDAFYELMSLGGNVRRAGELVMQFSPDGRYFVAAHSAFSGASRLVYDLEKRVQLSLPNQSLKMLDTGFTFLSADKVLALNATQPGRSTVVTIPSGVIGETFAFPVGLQEATADGKHVMIRPMEDHAVGVFDLSTRKLVKTSVTSAFDVYGHRYVAERGVSDIGVHDLDNDRIIGQATLPPTSLSALRAVGVSADFGWVAVSERTRGVLWNASTGAVVRFVRDFDGAFIDETGSLFADLPEAGAQPRAIMRLDSKTGAVSNAGDVGKGNAQQRGRWLLSQKAVSPVGTEYALRDVQRPAPVWTQRVLSTPDEVWLEPGSDAVVLSWHADVRGAARIRDDPALRKRVNFGDTKGDYVIELLDLATGRDRGRTYIETGRGSFAVRSALVNGDRLFVTDTLGRVLQYAFSTGELRGYAFGESPVIHEAAGLLAVSAGAGRVVLYDLNTMRRRSEMTFSRDVVLTAFSADGSRLFALTADQVAYIVPVSR